MLVPFFCGEEGVLGESVENTASPPTPLRMERGVVCEVTPIGPASPPTPLQMERGVVCEVTPIRLLTYFIEIFISRWAVSSLTVGSFFSHGGEFFLSQNSQI